MNLAIYIAALERSGRNLPNALFEWDTIDADLRAHYGDALIELLASHEQALRIARGGAQQDQLSRAWGAFVKVVVQHAGDIAELMDVNPLTLLAPLSVSADSPVGADAQPEDDTRLGVAA